MKINLLKYTIIAVLQFITVFAVSGQTTPATMVVGPLPVPDIYRRGSINEQFNQLEAHTKIYQNFRAIREDIYQLISKNVKDSLGSVQKKINALNAQIAALNKTIDSLHNYLGSTRNSLVEMTKRQYSISVLGLQINKTAYNSIMWSIVGIAVLLLLIGYYLFKKNRETTLKAKTELADLQREYEDYKQKKRIETEKMTMQHFLEMKKLKETHNLK